MPRRKKLPAVPNYKGTARNADDMLVQKSTPLQTLAETNLTLPEFKILDAYLSRIDSHKPDERYVRFEKGELERLLGVTQLKKEDLSKRIDNLFQVITIRDPNKPKGFTKIGLFEKAEAFQDDDGLWQIDLACSASAMEYVFNIENLRYLKYRLKNVIELTSRYSYVLYLYLEKNHKRKSWDVSLDELKRILNCTSESYSAYKEFNDKILKKCQREINEKTNLSYTYEPIKRGRKVTAVKFTIDTIATETLKQAAEQEQITLNELDLAEKSEKEYSNSDIALLADACGNEFSQAEMDSIFELISTRPMPEMSEGIWIARYHYLSQKYAMMNVYAEKHAIKDRYRYFLKILANDGKEMS